MSSPNSNKVVPDSDIKKESVNSRGGGVKVDQEKVLKVSWEKVGEDYSADKLRELFSKSALVAMATKEGAVAAIGGGVIVRLPYPLVLPLKPAMGADPLSATKSQDV